MSTFFTLVIPTKNRLSLLKECVASVQNQSYENYELLIVDDNSDDETKIWVLSLEDKRVSYILNKGIERSAARNTGMDYAKGSYICFIDDDDMLQPNYLIDFKVAIDAMGDNGDIIHRTNFKYFGDLIDNRIGRISSSFSKHKFKNELNFVIKEFTGVYTFCFPIAVAKRFRFDERFFLWQDTHFLIQVMLDGNKINQLQNANYLYRLHLNMGSRMVSIPQFKNKLYYNLAAMYDILNNFDGEYKVKLDIKVFKSMISKKKLEYASHANTLGLYYVGAKLYLDALSMGLYPSLWKNYGYYFVSLAKSII